MLKVGDSAPNFRLVSDRGGLVSLDDFLGKKNLVLYFYPKDRSPGCTREARTFKDSYSAIKELDAEVLGISPDDQDSHSNFARDEGLPFPLLSDSAGAMRKAYGVRPILGLILSRTTFVIDKQGVIKQVYSSQTDPTRHVEEALKALRSMS